MEFRDTDYRFPLPSSVGLNFGVQISWVVLNIITISLISIFMSKRFLKQYQKARQAAINTQEKTVASPV